MADEIRRHASRPTKRSVQLPAVRQPCAVMPPAKPSTFLDTRVVYCGDNLEHLAMLPD